MELFVRHHGSEKLINMQKRGIPPPIGVSPFLIPGIFYFKSFLHSYFSNTLLKNQEFTYAITANPNNAQNGIPYTNV